MFEELEQAIDYSFKDKSLLKLAMTHPSYAGETHVHNQRLEFLGDAVLQLCTSVRLYHQYPDLPEGMAAGAKSPRFSPTRWRRCWARCIWTARWKRRAG